MDLPDLSWQFMYGRVAWALVLASLVAAVWPATPRLRRGTLAVILGACAVVMALPGAASPAWHLGLAFQYPSALLLGLCLVGLHGHWSGAPPARLMPVGTAALLAVVGAFLYLDAAGLLARSAYYAGFGATKAPLAAVLLACASALAAARGHWRPQACALLAALLLFSLARLPTGNLWDAVLDPLLWGWAVTALCGAGLRRLLAGRRRAIPATGTGNEPFSPIKE
ncbi:hypothetical protein [Massilia sp. H6]|uniref:hypothetical protein n=1 Tax=Massilia sp. H6 TaxID=2970464 RepID=UPI002169C590|nr:hypothetical protein [Massilia sp. H6]UVW27226.1 hypothetical protein NRS07_11685 [Massilia sp. H6]